jgi:hypothetical protein
VSLRLEEAKSVRATLLKSTELQDLIEDGGLVGSYRIFTTMRPKGSDLPYIFLRHVSGGLMHDSQLPYLESEWLVEGVTELPEEIGPLETAIEEALRDVVPEATERVAPFGPIEWLRPFFENWNVQNHTYYYVGGFIRTRYMICEA